MSDLETMLAQLCDSGPVVLRSSRLRGSSRRLWVVNRSEATSLSAAVRRAVKASQARTAQQRAVSA